MERFLRNKTFKKIVFGVLFFAMLLTPMPVAAQGGGNCSSPSFFFLRPWSSYLPCRNGEVTIRSITDFIGLAMWAVDSLLKLVVYVSAGFIIFGGVKYMMAQGDQSSIAEAKSTVVNAGIGLVIAIASVALVQFITRTIV